MRSEQQIARYSRQIILPAVGGKGQQRLLSASVAVVGAGEMASAVALYLSAAGLGAMTLAGADRAPGELEALNPDCRVTSGPLPLATPAAADLTCGHSVVVAADAAHEINLILNAACVSSGRPLVWGEASGYAGRFAVLAAQRPDAPCYRCLRAGIERNEPLPSTPLTATVAAFVGAMQAAEVIKLILGMESARSGRLFSYDALAAAMRETALTKDPQCEVCGTGASGRAEQV